MDYYKDKLEILLKGLLILILLVTSADAATWTVAPSSGPGIDYTRIQDAINAATASDTILVQSGTYYENVDVNKQLTLQGVGAPVVDAGGLGRAITLNADGCILDGFVAINSGSDDYDAGILVNSNNNTITGNTATGNGVGIWFHSSSNNKISGNTANNNTGVGISLHSFSSGNTITGNTVNGNYDGIGLVYSPGNVISDNAAAYNIRVAIGLYHSDNNAISGNTFTGNGGGIFLLESCLGNTILGNTISNNSALGNSAGGIDLLDSCNDNIISCNTVAGNYYGIRIEDSTNNVICLNSFKSNTINGLSDGSNHWNATTIQTYEQGGQNITGFLGNIWSDYDGFECDGDGMGDVSYLIAGGSDKDYHPIGGLEPGPVIEVEKTADRSEVQIGETINYTIWVNNTGNVNLTRVQAEDNLTGAIWNVGTLAPGQNYTNTTRYQVSISDLPGPLTNLLWANGTDPCGGEVNASAIETIEIQPSCTGVPKVLTVCASSCNYTSIQAAINDACPGDTIQVHSGTYNEHVVVNKTLTLQGVDTGSGLPVVDAGDSGDAITISADGCTVEDFKARNSGAWLCAGIHVTSNGNTISVNTLTGNLYGIRLDSSSNNTISGNTATGNIASGIYIYSASNNTISGNIATGNIASGIDLYRSSGNTISGNTANGNSQCGIRIFGPSTGNSISNNFANGNSWGGIYMTDSSGSAIFGNIVSNNSASGIGISSSSNITISDNTAKDNSQFGIFIFGPSTDNTVSDNTATGNGYHGISLSSSSNGNTISANTITRNSLYGIRLDSSCNGNSIYLNTLDNTNNAWSNGANDWNSTTSITWEHNGRTLTGLLGNIWSDYDGLDCDGDGMGDAPYLIAGGSDKDYHPIGGLEPGPGIEVEKIADRSEAQVSETINYTIRVNNTGNVSLTGVRAWDNLTGAVWTVVNLAPGQNYTNTTRYRVLPSDLPGPIAN